jgi:hypothetical protein
MGQLVHSYIINCIFCIVFCNIFVTGIPVKFGLPSPGRARQWRSRAYPGQGGNRTLPTHPNLSLPFPDPSNCTEITTRLIETVRRPVLCANFMSGLAWFELTIYVTMLSYFFLLYCIMLLQRMQYDFVCLFFIWGEGGGGFWALRVWDQIKLKLKLKLNNLLHESPPLYQQRYAGP